MQKNGHFKCPFLFAFQSAINLFLTRVTEVFFPQREASSRVNHVWFRPIPAIPSQYEQGQGAGEGHELAWLRPQSRLERQRFSRCQSSPNSNHCFVRLLSILTAARQRTRVEAFPQFELELAQPGAKWLLQVAAPVRPELEHSAAIPSPQAWLEPESRQTDQALSLVPLPRGGPQR